MLNLSLNKLKLIAKSRHTKGYKSMSKERLSSTLNESESVKEREKKSDGAKIEKIKKHFNKLWDRFSRSKIKKIRKDLYRIKDKKIFPHRK